MLVKKPIFYLCSLIILLSSIIYADDVSATEEKQEAQVDKKDQVNPSAFRLPEIIVKGYGFDDKFKNISGSVNVYTQEDIKRTQSRSLNELISRTPGFQAMSLAIVDYMIIRGTGSMYDLKGKSHAVFYNGIPLLATEMKNIMLTDEVESVEVLKGPQHVLFGSNARSGAVNIVTKKPEKTTGTVTLGFGNDSTYQLGWNQFIKINDVIGLGFGFDKSYDGGFVNNISMNNKKGGFNATNFNFNLSVKPTPKTDIDVYYAQQKVNSKKPILVAFDKELTPSLFYYANFDEAQTPMLEGEKLNFWEERTDFGGVDNRKSTLFSFSIKQLLSENIFVRYVFANSKFTQNTLVDMDITDIPIFNQVGATNVTHDYKASSTYHDLRFSGYHDKFKWIAGISKTRDYSRRLAAGNPFGIPIRMMRMGDTVDGKAIYTQLNFEPSPYFDISAGYRRQVDHVKPEFYPFSDNGLINDAFSNIIEPFIQNVVVGKTLPSRYSSAANLWSATATVHPTPDILFYTTVSKGYVSGGYQSFVTNNLILPERGTSTEAGFKAQLFSDKLLFTGSIYKNRYKDYQYFNFLKYSMENIPEFEATGGEISLYIAPIPNILIGFTHSKVNPKIKDYQMKDAFGFVDMGYYNDYEDLTTFKNKSIPWIPRSNSSVNLILQGKIKSVDVAWDTTLSRRGKVYLDFGNKQVMKPINLLDSTVTLRKENHEVAIWGKNLTNKKYFSSGYSAGISLGTYGRSRSYGLSYKVKF